MDAKLPDPRPLIHVCDRHDFVEEMTSYLHSNQLQKLSLIHISEPTRLLSIGGGGVGG